MDNAAFHQRADIRQLIEGAGHRLEYWPTYSPDLNPIEHQWAQSKAIRKQKHCSVEELFAYYSKPILIVETRFQIEIILGN